MELNERRAIFVYEAARCLNIATGAPINPEVWEDRLVRFRLNMIKAVERQTRPDRSFSPSGLHDEWVRAYVSMGWKWGPVRDMKKRTHPDMVPFDDLGALEQAKDRQFMQFCDMAKEWVRE